MDVWAEELMKIDIKHGQRFRAVLFLTAAAMAVIMTAAAAFYLQQQTPRPSEAVQWNAPVTEEVRGKVRDNVRGDKPVYPHSVVRGGVHSTAEVHRAMAQDSLVRAHYQGINAEKMIPAVLKSNLSAYVSYKKQGRIFWTAKTLRLTAGEAVLDDGQHLIRARCGNRISLTPQLPVITPGSEEPAATEFDTAVALPPELLTRLATGTYQFPYISAPVAAYDSDAGPGRSLTGPGTGSGSGGKVPAGTGSGGTTPGGTTPGGFGRPLPGDFSYIPPASITDAIPTDFPPGFLIDNLIQESDLFPIYIPALLHTDRIFTPMPWQPTTTFPITVVQVVVTDFSKPLLPNPVVPIEEMVAQLLTPPTPPESIIASYEVTPVNPVNPVVDVLPLPPVPEPQTYGLVGIGLALLLLSAKRRGLRDRLPR